MRVITYGALLLIALALVGCASPTSSILIGDARPEIPVEQVKVYLEAPDSYEEIALIEASSDASWSFGEQAKMDGSSALFGHGRCHQLDSRT